MHFVAIGLAVSLFLASCNEKHVTYSQTERNTADSIVRANRNINSLDSLQQLFEREDNKLGIVIALRERGRLLRDESRFDEALSAHLKGLEQAEEMEDTFEIVQALNNIGTDYRRMGILDVAHDYHYRARVMCEENNDTTSIAKKNFVVSLNGLGNVYMTLGNYDRADSVLRQALLGEQKLNSKLGQAINYANLGYIFEQREDVDSAWVYYRRSMALNQELGNTLGISLCNTYFGSLYEKAHQYEKATQEYERAYELMQRSKDEWHALNPLIALAGIHYTTNNDAKALEYLTQAKTIAARINSNEHLAEIHTLYYKIYKRKGNFKEALSAYENTTASQDSVLDIEKVNRIQNAILNIERACQIQQVNDARLKLKQERNARYIGYGLFSMLVLFLIGLIAMMFYIYKLRSRSHITLKKMTKLREEFFTNITHEFRTPLTIILGLSHDMQKHEEPPADFKEKMLTIERQGNGLLTLINQLLGITKIKSSIGNPDWCHGNITAHIVMIVETYREYAREHNIDLQIFARDDVEMDFVPDYVTKSMNNLISNSFKYTPEYGKISIVVWQENNKLKVDVTDTGGGIPEEFLEHIFEPFYQVGDNKANLGTGVGLALVKQVVEAVGGKISVRSEVGVGTSFHISAPIKHNIAHKRAESGEKNIPLLHTSAGLPVDSEINDSECRLLIVEDNKDIANYIGSQLSDRYNVFYASDGLEGVKRAMSIVPDLIITDLMMPGIDGLELCRQIRGSEITNHIPVIVVTAKESDDDRIEVMEAGADAYLAKPFKAE